MEKLGGSCSFSLVWMGKIHRSWAFSVSGKEPLSLQDQQHFRLQGVTLEALAEASLMEGGFPKIQHFRGQTVPASCGLDSLDGEEATERAKHPPGCEGDGRLKSWSCQGFAGGGGWGRPAAIWEQIQAGWLGNTWERWKCWAVYPRGEQRPQEGTKQSDLSGTGVFNKETVKKKKQIAEQLLLAKGFGNHTWHRNTAQLSSSEPELGGEKGEKGIALYTPYGVERKKIPQTNKVLNFIFFLQLPTFSPGAISVCTDLMLWLCLHPNKNEESPLTLSSLFCFIYGEEQEIICR